MVNLSRLISFTLLLSIASISYGSPLDNLLKPFRDPPPDVQRGIKAFESGDYNTASRILIQASDYGDAEAKLYLAHLYRYGVWWRVPKNTKKALALYRESAELGFWGAQFMLGVDNYNGDLELGLAQDKKKAFYWFKLAAQQRDARSQVQVAQAYWEGEGTAQDYIYAHMWYNFAAAQGNEVGITMRDILTDQMTASQIEKAQDLARQCLKKNYKDC